MLLTASFLILTSPGIIRNLQEYEDEIQLKVFLCILKKKIETQESFFSFYSQGNLTQLFLLQEMKPSPDQDMIKLLTFDNLFPSLRHFH